MAAPKRQARRASAQGRMPLALALIGAAGCAGRASAPAGASSPAPSSFAGPVEVRQQAQDDPCAAGAQVPLDDAGRRLAADAERALLLRITGAAPDVFDAEFLRGLSQKASPLYVIADRPILLPKGPPELRHARDRAGLARIAREHRKDVYFILLEARGTAPAGPNGPAVRIDYTWDAIDWQRAAQEAPPQAGQAAPLPRRVWTYGGYLYLCVVRAGRGLVFFDGVRVVG